MWLIDLVSTAANIAARKVTFMKTLRQPALNLRGIGWFVAIAYGLAWLPLFMISFPLQALLLTPLAFGEQWGWRGYLLPRLLPLGQWPALLLSGAIWGLWHAPVILLGYNYPQHPILGVLVMVGTCAV